MPLKIFALPTEFFLSLWVSAAPPELELSLVYYSLYDAYLINVFLACQFSKQPCLHSLAFVL